MQLPEDTYMHKGQRRKLLEELRDMGIRDERVLLPWTRCRGTFSWIRPFRNSPTPTRPFRSPQAKPSASPTPWPSKRVARGPARGFHLGNWDRQRVPVCRPVRVGLQGAQHRTPKSALRRRWTVVEAMGWKPALYYGDGYKGKPVFAPSTASSSRAGRRTCLKRCWAS